MKVPNEWARGHLSEAIHLGKGVIERAIELVGSEIRALC